MAYQPSRWLRDYVYIPLGGSVAPKHKRTATCCLPFWSRPRHGAGWTYLVWGGLHGLCQAAENHLRPGAAGVSGMPCAWRGLSVFWWGAFVIFRASSLSNAAQIFRGILCNGGHAVFSNYWELGLTSMQEQLTSTRALPACWRWICCMSAVSRCGKIAALPLPVRWAVYEAAVLRFFFMGRFLGGGSPLCKILTIRQNGKGCEPQRFASFVYFNRWSAPKNLNILQPPSIRLATFSV